MKLELIIFGITGLFIYNTFYENKLSKYIFSCKKYIQIGAIIFVAYSLYMMIRKKPQDTRNMILYANQAIKHLPINKSSMDMLTPIFDFTSGNGNSAAFMETFNKNIYGDDYQPCIFPTQQQQQPPTMASTYPQQRQKASKRSVSETKKKYVAYMQDWKCGMCDSKLTHTFEVDHKLSLGNGGGNDTSNLVALCRECHGQKTATENM